MTQVPAAIDPDALEALWTLIGNYCHINVFNDAYYRFFSQEFYDQYVQEDVENYMGGEFADAKSAQAYAGPQGPAVFYESSRISGDPMPPDVGSIAEGDTADDKPKGGTYFRGAYSDFKRLGYLTSINPRYQRRFEFARTTTFDGFTNIFEDDKTWRWRKQKYKQPFWQLDENIGASDGTIKFPPPAQLPDGGEVVLRVALPFFIERLSEKNGCYFVSPSILNVLARRGVQLRDMSKSASGRQAHKAPEYAARAQLYTDLYKKLMHMLYRITFIEEKDRTESATVDNPVNLGGYRGYYANHPNILNQPQEAHSYWLAGEFIADPATTMAMVDDPSKHPDTKFHWLHPTYRYDQAQAVDSRRSTNPFTRTLQVDDDDFRVPGIMNYAKRTFVLAGAPSRNDARKNGNKVEQFVSAQLGQNPSYTVDVNDAILALMRSEMGYVEVQESEEPPEDFLPLVSNTARTAKYGFEGPPVFGRWADYWQAYQANVNELFRLFNAAHNDSTGAAEIASAQQLEEAHGRAQAEAAAAAAREEANRNRRPLTPLDIQCYLLENIGRLSQREGDLRPSYKHSVRLDTQRNPALVLNALEKKLSPEEAQALVGICPEIQAALVPYFKLYRVDYDRRGKPIGKDIEFEIPNFLSENDISQITTSGTGRVPGAGMKKFTWSLDGVQPATVDNNISATLELYFQTVNDFFQDTYKAGDPNKPSFLDLVIASPGPDSDDAATSRDDPGEDPKSPEGCRKRIESQLSERYDGARFRIKVIAGWATPPDLLEMFPGLGKEKADLLRAALTKQKTTLFLQQTRHDIDFRQDGSMTLTINYQAALTGILTAQTANIFAPRTLASAEVESYKDKISDLEEVAGKSGATTQDKEALKKALEEFQRLQEQDKLLRYRKLLEGLFCSGKIYNLAIPRTHLLLPPLMQMTPDGRAGRAKARSSAALRISQGGNTSVLLDEISAATRGGGSGEDAAQATSEVLTKKYDEMGPGGRAKSIIFGSYIYLGDLIDNILSQIKINNNGAGLDVPFVLSEVPMIDPLQAYKIENIEEVVKCTQNLEDAKFIDALHKQDPYNFPKGVGVIQLLNIGDIPISLDAFQVWFKDKVVKPGRSHYYFLHFVKDLCADLISGALTSDCFGERLRFVQRFDCQPFSVSTKQHPFRPNTTVALETLARQTTQVDDSTDTTNIRLGLILMSTDTKPKGLSGMTSYESDTASGVYHHYLGSPCGLVKSINFNREDQPYLRESKIQREGSLDASQLRELYSANIQLYGNTLYRNGSYIYINPRLLGAPDKQLRTLGLHGYYLVTGVASEITERGFNVQVRALAEGQEFDSDKFLAPDVSRAEPIPEPFRSGAADPPRREEFVPPTREPPPPVEEQVKTEDVVVQEGGPTGAGRIEVRRGSTSTAPIRAGTSRSSTGSDRSF